MHTTQRRRGLVASALVASVALAVAGCGSSSKKSSGGTTATSAAGAGTTSKTITIGFLTDKTGPASSEYATAEEGMKAGVGYAAQHGVHVKYILADTQSSPTGALTAAQKLVEQNHVTAVVPVSSLTYAAAAYLTKEKIPVIGFSLDGPEWMAPSSTNMFSVLGNTDTSKVTNILGNFMKSQGVTSLGTVGYGVSPSAQQSTRGAAASAIAVGLKAPFVDANFQFGGTNVAPDVLAMKSAGVDGFSAQTDPNTAFAFIQGLKQQGVNLKAALLLTGYGGDLTRSGAAAEAAAQGDDFQLGYEPIEMNTPATQQLENLLKSQAGVNSEPTFADYIGYIAMAALTEAVQKAGSNVTSASLITALSSIHDFDAAGLLGGQYTIDLASKEQPNRTCAWFVKWQGSSFHLIQGADPLCGTILPGVKPVPG